MFGFLFRKKIVSVFQTLKMDNPAIILITSDDTSVNHRLFREGFVITIFFLADFPSYNQSNVNFIRNMVFILIISIKT